MDTQRMLAWLDKETARLRPIVGDGHPSLEHQLGAYSKLQAINAVRLFVLTGNDNVEI